MKRKVLIILLIVVSVHLAGGLACSEGEPGGYRGQFGDVIGIADKVHCPQGGCPKIGAPTPTPTPTPPK